MRRAILTFSPWSLGLKKISILVADSEYILHLAKEHPNAARHCHCFSFVTPNWVFDSHSNHSVMSATSSESFEP